MPYSFYEIWFIKITETILHILNSNHLDLLCGRYSFAEIAEKGTK